MEQITKFKADDGREFYSSNDCLDYENLCNETKKTLLILGEKPEECGFTNGGGYLQHLPESVMTVKRWILEKSKGYTDHKWIQQTLDDMDGIDPSWAGRIIGETCPDPLYRAWNRISCIDSKFREWGQPYYRNNPEEAKQTQLN